MIDASRIRQHMTVAGSDSRHVGTVDSVEGGAIRLTRSDAEAGGRHHLIPLAWVLSVDGDQVSLDREAEAAKAGWTEA